MGKLGNRVASGLDGFEDAYRKSTELIYIISDCFWNITNSNNISIAIYSLLYALAWPFLTDELQEYIIPLLYFKVDTFQGISSTNSFI